MSSFSSRVDGLAVASFTKALGLTCFAGLALVIGAHLALAEPAPLAASPQLTAGHAPALDRPRLVPRPPASRIEVIVTPLDLVRLDPTAFADWDNSQPQR